MFLQVDSAYFEEYFRKFQWVSLCIFEQVHNACENTLHESTMTLMAVMEFIHTISVFALSCTTA